MLPSEALIRPMTAGDVPAVAQIETQSFPVPWSEAALAAELGHSYATLLVAELAGRVAGYIGFYTIEGEALALITNIAVDPDQRGQGLGAALLQSACERARAWGAERMVLEARRGNLTALRLYERHGFIVLGTRKNAYEHPPEDALVLQKSLKGERA